MAIITAYYAAFTYQFGAPIETTYGVSDWARFKEQIAKETTGNRLLIFGDSSSLFGMNTPLLSEKTGMTVVNMALHGGLPLDWTTKYALENAKDGDTVIMPLAWTYYYADYRTPGKWSLDQVIAWDAEYFYGLNLVTKVRYIIAMDTKSLYTNVKKKINKEEILKRFPLRRALTKEEIKLQHKTASKDPSQSFSYSFLNISNYGDMQGGCGNLSDSLSSYDPLDQETKDVVFDHLEKTAEEMRNRGIKFFIAPSISLDDQNSQKIEYRAKLKKILAELSGRGIKVVGNPDDFYFPAHAFYDTNFHLNCEISTRRTLKLYDAIKDVI